MLFSGYVTSAQVYNLPLDADGLFETGDIFACDGNRLRYVGRRDRRLKWRGHRIEPEEIERLICLDHRITHAQLLIPNDGSLVCEIVSTLPQPELESTVRDRLLRNLPSAVAEHVLVVNRACTTPMVKIR